MEATHMSRQFWRSRWWMPGFCLFLGDARRRRVPARRRPWMALWGFGLMVGLGALAFFGRRSETIQGLSGPGPGRALGHDRPDRDRLRRPRPDHARCIGMWLYEIANGRDGNPYGLSAAIAGVAYLAGVAWGRFRR